MGLMEVKKVTVKSLKPSNCRARLHAWVSDITLLQTTHISPVENAERDYVNIPPMVEECIWKLLAQ